MNVIGKDTYWQTQLPGVAPLPLHDSLPPSLPGIRCNVWADMGWESTH